MISARQIPLAVSASLRPCLRGAIASAQNSVSLFPLSPVCSSSLSLSTRTAAFSISSSASRIRETQTTAITTSKGKVESTPRGIGGIYSAGVSPSSSYVLRRWSSSSSGDVKTWTYEDILNLTKHSPKDPTTPTLIDVREPSELADSGHIPGAINVPLKSRPDSFRIPADEFEDHFGFRRPEREHPVVFYCKAGVRSRAAAGLARDAGWTDVGEYPGSWDDWVGRGGEVER